MSKIMINGTDFSTPLVNNKAKDIKYDNTDSHLSSTTMQDAIDEINTKAEIIPTASQIRYKETNVGSALNAVETSVSGLNTKINNNEWTIIEAQETTNVRVIRYFNPLLKCVYFEITTKEYIPNSTVFYTMNSNNRPSENNRVISVIAHNQDGTIQISNITFKTNGTIRYDARTKDTGGMFALTGIYKC